LKAPFAIKSVKTEKGFTPMRLIILLLIITTVAVPVAAGDFPIKGTKDTELTVTLVATF
jgi:competence protein ComGC